MSISLHPQVHIGFLDKAEVRKAGGVNLFWGLLLQEINTVVSKNGSRMILKVRGQNCMGRMIIFKVKTWPRSRFLFLKCNCYQHFLTCPYSPYPQPLLFSTGPRPGCRGAMGGYEEGQRCGQDHIDGNEGQQDW